MSQTTADKIVSYVNSKIGCSYSFGSAGPDTFDCSGLVQAAHASAGVSIKRTSSNQAKSGTEVSIGSQQPGDILCFAFDGNGVSHVGIFIGNGKFVHAPNGKETVTSVDVKGYWSKQLVAVRRNW
jgi:cell wall-associated NlpC family hydrolase